MQGLPPTDFYLKNIPQMPSLHYPIKTKCALQLVIFGNWSKKRSCIDNMLLWLTLLALLVWPSFANRYFGRQYNVINNSSTPFQPTLLALLVWPSYANKLHHIGLSSLVGMIEGGCQWGQSLLKIIESAAGWQERFISRLSHLGKILKIF